MDPNKALAILVGLVIVTFTLRLYRQMLLSQEAGLRGESAQEREIPDGLLEQRLSMIQQCRRILDVTILAMATGIALLAR